MTAFYPYSHMKVEHNYTGSTWQDFTGNIVSFRLVLREFTGKHSAQVSFYNDTMNPALSSGTPVVKKGDKVRIFMDNPSGTSRKVATMKIAKVSTSDQDFTRPTGKQVQVTLDLIGTGITGVGGAA